MNTTSVRINSTNLIRIVILQIYNNPHKLIYF